MPQSVSELAQLAGVSVRTLHYYDQIGLLQPTEVRDNGYRYYDQSSAARLQQILFLRELDFSLNDIKEILANPAYEQVQALREQRQLLLLKRQRLDGLINLIEQQLKGEQTMDFQAFATDTIDEYKEEAKTRWGATTAWRESQKKAADYTPADLVAINQEAETIFAEFADHLGQPPTDPAVQQLVLRWQAHITRYYYNCSKEILASLGQMYTADARFTTNIDRCGVGTAQLMAEAIACYCQE